MTKTEAIERIKTRFNKWALDDKDLEAIVSVIPELAESDDEKIRKFICGIIDNLEPKDFVDVKKMNVLAWLEKHKELPFVKDVMLGYPGHYFYDGERMHFCGNPAMEEKQKEQKPEKINITEMVANYRVTDEYVDGEYKGKPVNCMIRAYEQGIRDTLLKVKEQKPAEITPNQFDGITYGMQGYSTEKTAEWSEDTLDEFTENIRSLITRKLTYHNPNGSGISSTVFIDDETAKDIANGVLFYVGKEAVKNPHREIPEWSEEDKLHLNNAILAAEREWGMDSCTSRWLKLLPERFNLQPTWKPSEKQLAELGLAIHGLSASSNVLRSLYNDLKKLM